MYFSYPVLFEIPVLPRVKKFISAKLRDAQGTPQPMLVSPDAQGAGLMLWAMAQSEKVMLHVGWRRKGSRTDWQTDSGGHIIAPADYTEQLGLGIQEFHRKSRHQYLLNYAELMVFSNFVDSVIHCEAAEYCRCRPELSARAAIRQFCDAYDFSDEELDERALHQWVWRQDKTPECTMRISSQRHFLPIDYAEAA